MQPTTKDLEEKEELLIEVMHQLYRDVRDGEGQAIYEMIERLPDYVLKGYKRGRAPWKTQMELKKAMFYGV